MMGTQHHISFLKCMLDSWAKLLLAEIVFTIFRFDGQVRVDVEHSFERTTAVSQSISKGESTSSINC